MTITHTLFTAAAWILTASLAFAAPADSKRLGHAKDLIADEQWTRAIAELQAAVDDPKEVNRAEALFWLAHSEHQAGDDAAALQTIARLEKTASASPWVGPARSLRIEIAHRLRRDDVLWMTVVPPAPPAAPQPSMPTPAIAPAPPAPAMLARPASTPRPVAVPPAAPRTPPAVAATAPPPPAVPPPPAPFAEYWLPATAPPDMTLKLQAMTGLLDTHSAQVIPLLRAIALDANSPDEARQAVFVLGQSRRPEAERTVLEVARTGAEPVRIAAVRELGRFDSPSVSTELMQVYALSATPRLKRQIVASLGDRADSTSLLRIAKTEQESTVRDLAIVTLGHSGSREQLRTLYGQAPAVSRAAVLSALFAAKDDDELIRIATTETNPALRLRARQHLRMLATPKAVKFLDDNP
jgi:hypothetical protein